MSTNSPDCSEPAAIAASQSGAGRTAADRAHHEVRVGLYYGLAAYLWWGGVAVYFRAVASVAPLEVLAHRIVWSVAMLGVMLALRRRLGDALTALRSRRTALTLAATTGLIAINWFTFIYAVGRNQVLQASLGYYINPLVNVLLGMIFLRERLNRVQTVSVILAAAGVVYLTAYHRQVPAIALILALSFGFYGLLRKTARVDAMSGLTVETALLLPAALAYLAWQGRAGTLSFGNVSWRTDVLLCLAGAVTAIPLVWFAHAARRLRLSTVGLLQYIAPSGQFLLAVTLFGERFTAAHAVAFACIWMALALYTIDAVRGQRRLARQGDAGTRLYTAGGHR